MKLVIEIWYSWWV